MNATTGAFRWPGGDARTSIIGATGSGKSNCGVWMLAHQRFDKRPWVAIDFKREGLFDAIGFPPIAEIGLRTIPRKPGLYLVTPHPNQDDELEDWLGRVWQRENIGLYVDEASLMPDGANFRAVLQQGRSKRIPVIACTQRPVSVARAVFSEASFFCVYRLADKRDYSVVQGFVPADLSLPMPPWHWHWYDVQRNVLLHMGPVPKPAATAQLARERIPAVAQAWHPFGWTSKPTGRAKQKAS